MKSGWAPDSVQTFQKREKSLLSSGDINTIPLLSRPQLSHYLVSPDFNTTGHNAAHISLPFVPGRHHLPRRPFAIHVGLMRNVLMSTGDEYKLYWKDIHHFI